MESNSRPLLSAENPGLNQIPSSPSQLTETSNPSNTNPSDNTSVSDPQNDSSTNLNSNQGRQQRLYRTYLTLMSRIPRVTEQLLNRQNESRGQHDPNNN